MRIFLTGATGHVGGAVLDALVRGGHDVTALVRNNEKAAAVSSRGGRPTIGDLSDPTSFAAAAEAQDGYIHAAFEAVSGRWPDIERAALDVILKAARRPRTVGSTGPDARFVVYTSGLWVLGQVSEPAAEDVPVNPVALAAWRPVHEQFVLGAGGASLRTIVVRPGIVYGGGDGLVADVFKAATNGLVRVVGDGNNRWPLVYDRDLADLYSRLASNEGAAGLFHANDEGDERVNDIVDGIGSHLHTPPDVRHIPLEEARAKMGPFAEAVSLDQVVRSPRARALGWTPGLRSVAGNIPRLLEEWRAARSRAA